MDKGEAWLAADSLVTNGHTVESTRSGKLFRAGPFVVGCAGDVAWHNLLRYKVDWPTKTPKSVARWLSVELQEALPRKHADGASLVAVDGHLYYLDSQGAFFSPIDRYMAIGSGGEAALAALAVLDEIAMAPRDRLKLVLSKCEKHTAYVRRPWLIMRAP